MQIYGVIYCISTELIGLTNLRVVVVNVKQISVIGYT